MSSNTDAECVISGIRKVGPDNWEFRANNPAGRGKQIRRRGFPSQQAAYQARNLYLGGAELKVKGSTFNLTVGEWLDTWLIQVKETRRPTTFSGYRKAINRDLKPTIGDIQLTELTSEDVRNCYRAMVDKGFATATIEGTSRRLKTALFAAMNEVPPLITFNPAGKSVTPPKGKPPKRHTIWTFTNLTHFARFAATQPDAAMWAFWLTTGVRRGELCGLYWDKVLFEVAETVIDWQRTKTADGLVVEGSVKTDAGERRVPIVPQVANALRTWKADQAALRLKKGERWRGGDYVFTTQRGTAWFPDSLNKRLIKLCSEARLPRVSPHELRHTYATRALENGMDIKILSTMLGHSKVETTMNLYVWPNTKQMHDAQAELASRMFG